MVDFFRSLFGKKSELNQIIERAPAEERVALEDPDVVFERARAEAEMKTAFHAQTWGQGQTDRWDADLDAGTITFIDDTRRQKIVAPLQIVGTLNTNDGTWLWGWDHPSVPVPLAQAADQVRQFGERHGLEALTTRKIIASEDDAWTFTALACHLIADQGVYRGPTGPTLVFMTFGNLTISRL